MKGIRLQIPPICTPAANLCPPPPTEKAIVPTSVFLETKLNKVIFLISSKLYIITISTCGYRSIILFPMSDLQTVELI